MRPEPIGSNSPNDTHRIRFRSRRLSDRRIASRSSKAATMSDFVSSRNLTTTAAGRAVTDVRPAALQVLVVSLLVALVTAGCSGGQGNVVVMFPQHGAPLGTDNGGHYFAGQLVLNEGCLRVEIPSDPTRGDNPALSRLLILPTAFTLDTEDGALRIIDGTGRVAAHIGDHVRFSGATISYQEAQNQGLIQGLSEECAGPNFLVGDEVTAFDPNNEPTELRLSDPDVLFPRQRTIIASIRTRFNGKGIGELVLEGRCLRLKSGDRPSYLIIWPPGFTPHVHNGVVQVRNGGGRIIAQVGDRIAGGGLYGLVDKEGCPAPSWRARSIEVLPNIDVYFPQQDGTLKPDNWMETFVGKLVLDGKCLKIDDAIRVSDRVIVPGLQHLLIWPDTFTLSTEDDVVGIVDASGRVVARVGDEIQFSAVSISYQEAMEHSGLREISGACSGPYWFVGDDFAAVPDSESS